MSDIFISYARSTASQAHQVAEALRLAGYEVWLDDELPAHRTYADVIDEQLLSAKAVVVIWSAEAVKSQWVRSEADTARKASTLVQVSVDGVLPPRPFDQIQCADLKGWHGDTTASGWCKVVASVAELSGKVAGSGVERVGAARDLAATVQTRTWPQMFRRRTWGGPWGLSFVAAALLLAALAGVGWLARDYLWSSQSRVPGALKVAVLPFDALSAGQGVRYFADSLQDEIAGVLSGNEIEPVSRDTSAELRGPNARQAIERLGARLILDGTVRSDGNVMHVRVHLDDPQAHVSLWSREFEAEVKDTTLLQTRVAYGMVAVLTCSREVLQPIGGLADQSLVSRYLHACDVFADWDVHMGYDAKGYAEWLETQRTLTVKAPNFAPAQYSYATFAAIAAKSSSRDTAAAMRREAEAHLSRGIALDPKSPNSYTVRSLFVHNTDWAERERLLSGAVGAAPSWPQGNMWLGAMLAETGRMREAMEYSQRAAAGDMVYDWGIFASSIACESAQPEQAIQDVERFRKLVPESIFAQDIHLFCLSNAERWDEARRVLQNLPQPDLETPLRGAALKAFLLAVRTKASADLKEARRLTLVKADQGPINLPAVISWLSALGFVDDAIALAQRWEPNSAGLNPNTWMFAPLTKNLRRDPRFMVLAARIGLVNYWRTSGHWPDFCSESGLHYDCRAEAARLVKTTKS